LGVLLFYTDNGVFAAINERLASCAVKGITVIAAQRTGDIIDPNAEGGSFRFARASLFLDQFVQHRVELSVKPRHVGFFLLLGLTERISFLGVISNPLEDSFLKWADCLGHRGKFLFPRQSDRIGEPKGLTKMCNSGQPLNYSPDNDTFFVAPAELSDDPIPSSHEGVAESGGYSGSALDGMRARRDRTAALILLHSLIVYIYRHELTLVCCNARLLETIPNYRMGRPREQAGIVSGGRHYSTRHTPSNELGI
jgi:hypothetical protein